jgi:methylmalonyl-CoA/ethylmalonyl-CoA epimerase
MLPPLEARALAGDTMTGIRNQQRSMEGIMRSLSLGLFIAGLLAGVGIQMAVGQNATRGMVALNHVGISVPDLDAAVAYYTETLGFPEAFRAVNDAGQTTLVYVQISRNTFVELQPANAQRPPGISHLGVEVENLAAVAKSLKERGANVEDPRAGSTKALLANVTDPNGIRVELLEITPDSRQREAIDRWEQRR